MHVAVETAIVDHYNDQLQALMCDPDKELFETIKKFWDEEQEHHDCDILMEDARFHTEFNNNKTKTNWDGNVQQFTCLMGIFCHVC